MTRFRLVRDRHRTVALAVLHGNRIFSYVPNLKAFIYDGPMSVDYLVDRDMTYEPVNASDAAEIIEQGEIGWLDDQIFMDLLTELSTESRRLTPDEVLGSADQIR